MDVLISSINTRTGLAAGSRHEPARQGHAAAGGDVDVLIRVPEVGGGALRWARRREAGPAAVDQGEAVGESERRCGKGGEDAGPSDSWHDPMGRRGPPTCQARAEQSSDCGCDR